MKPCKRCGSVSEGYSPTAQYCRKCHRLWMREHRLRKTYGMTLKEYDAMKARHGYRCAICGHPESESGRALHLDHSHAKGKVRGFLCFRCNQVLGRVRDNPHLLSKMASYLMGNLSPVGSLDVPVADRVFDGEAMEELK